MDSSHNPWLTVDRLSYTSPAAKRSCLQWLCHALKVTFCSPSSYFPVLTFLPPPLPYCSLSLRQNGTNTLFKCELSPITYSQDLEQLRITAFTPVQCRTKLLCLRLRVEFVYGCKHLSLKAFTSLLWGGCDSNFSIRIWSSTINFMNYRHRSSISKVWYLDWDVLGERNTEFWWVSVKFHAKYLIDNSRVPIQINNL